MKKTVEHTNHADFIANDERSETTTQTAAVDSTTPAQPRLPAYVAHF